VFDNVTPPILVNGIRQVERRSFLPAAIQRQSRKVTVLGQFRVSFMPVNVA
jgi:hypothetical protein